MPVYKLPMPDRDELLSLFLYDPETGILTRRKTGKEVGGRNEAPYPRIKINKVNYVTHRIIWRMMTEGPMPEEIDHISGVRTDKRWGNLRDATHGNNACNYLISKQNKSGFKGVCWFKPRGKWRAQIHLNRKQHHLGYFDDPNEAHAAYIEAAKRLHGKFANDGNGPICP